MRILHTSDWHLGATLHGAPRDEEHAGFLDWLRTELRREPVDALVVAGDVYEYLQPSAEAQRLLFSFLAGVADDGTARRVVIVGGNHDSASRLDAPAPVLESLRTTVVGGYDRDDEARCLVPVEVDGAVPLVVAAVPFVREFRLGVRALGIDATELSVQMHDAFAALYSRLADAAQERWPGARMVATGHLTCVGFEPGDFRTDLHHVGTVGGLRDEVFDSRFDYVALGHIHRAYPVGGDRRVWYSGSPIPLSITELGAARRVIRVELDGQGGRSVQQVTVPTFRRVLAVRGSLDQVEAGLRAIDVTDDERTPYVMAEVIEAERTPLLTDRLRQALALGGGRSATLVHVTQRRQAAEHEGAVERHAPSLRDMSPADVFAWAWPHVHGGDGPRPQVAQAFASLLVADEVEGA